MLETSTDSDTENVQNVNLRERLEPQPVKAWVSVAKGFASTPLDGDQHQPRFVPPIDLIVGVANEEKAKEFVAVWRIVKSRWLHEAFMMRSPPEFATRKAWKS